MTRKLQPFFWLALLAHLLLFLSFSLSLWNSALPTFEKKSDQYLPTYLYQKEVVSPQPSAAAQAARAASAPSRQLLSLPDTTAKIVLKKQEKTQDQQQTPSPPSASRPQTQGSTTATIEAESPTVGKPVDEPLLKELSRATAAKLYYPPEAAVFKLRGTATISFLLYPDGRVTDVQLAKSSGFRILDEAALATIRAISPVRDANLYLTKPRVLLAGIIFG